jgi:hypothetical protein
MQATDMQEQEQEAGLRTRTEDASNFRYLAARLGMLYSVSCRGAGSLMPQDLLGAAACRWRGRSKRWTEGFS